MAPSSRATVPSASRSLQRHRPRRPAVWRRVDRTPVRTDSPRPGRSGAWRHLRDRPGRRHSGRFLASMSAAGHAGSCVNRSDTWNARKKGDDSVARDSGCGQHRFARRRFLCVAILTSSCTGWLNETKRRAHYPCVRCLPRVATDLLIAWLTVPVSAQLLFPLESFHIPSATEEGSNILRPGAPFPSAVFCQ